MNTYRKGFYDRLSAIDDELQDIGDELNDDEEDQYEEAFPEEFNWALWRAACAVIRELMSQTWEEGYE